MKTVLAGLLMFFCSAATATLTPLPGSADQQGPAGTPFANPVGVMITNDQGQPQPGARVNWTISAQLQAPMPGYVCRFAGYDNTLCEGRADANGISSVGLVTAHTVGRFELSAVSFSADGRDLGRQGFALQAFSAGPRSLLEILGGEAQSASIGAGFAERIRVRVLRPDGTPLANAPIEFYLEGEGGQPWVYWDEPGGLSNWKNTDAGGLAQSPQLRADWGVGDGVVEVRLIDPVSRELVLARVKFTTTYADGSTVKSFQDLWWGGAAENGWGVTVAQQDTRLFNVVYAYDAAGEPTWFVASRGNWSYGFGSSYGGEIHSPTSAPYFAYDAMRFAPGPVVSYLSLTFDTKTGNRLDVGAIPANASKGTSKSLQRYEFSAGTTMPLQGVGGLWWGGASQNGWGISIAERPGALFVVWFTYGADGKPVWFSMSDARATGANTWTGNVFRTTGAPWGGVTYDASRFQARNVGTFELRFDGTQRATFTFDVEGHKGVLPLERFTF